MQAKNYQERLEVAKGSDILMEFNDWLEDYLNDEETVKLYSKWNEVINLNTGYFFGEKDTKIATAKEMLKDDIPLDSIIKYTKLNKEEILSLIED